MNKLLQGLSQNDMIKTENGALTHSKYALCNNVLAMFALGGSYRNRSDEDCITLFRDAFEENEILALKCLFYLRDVRGGQGERRFFRICYHWLAKNKPFIAEKYVYFVPEYGRWDDLLAVTEDTMLWGIAIEIITQQLNQDLVSDNPSLLAKWLPSANASSKETKALAKKIMKELCINPRQYRKMLSTLRKKIKIVETNLSQKQYDSIEFDKLPSKAGMKYSHCFSTRPETKERYAEFMADKSKKVNASVLNPVDITNKILNYNLNKTDCDVLQKYWENQKDYYNGKEENGLCVVDVSGSMMGQPMAAAIGMGLYIAERGRGPFANHFITFSENPQLQRVSGDDIVEKVRNLRRANWGYNTNFEKVMELILESAKKRKCKPEDMPERLYIFSDMEFDEGFSLRRSDKDRFTTLVEHWVQVYRDNGYEMPHVIFWNLNARQDNIPAIGDDTKFSYVSGFSMNMIEGILSGKDGWDLCLDKLLSERYDLIS